MLLQQKCFLDGSGDRDWPPQQIRTEVRPIGPPTGLHPNQGLIVESVVKTVRQEFQAMRDNNLAQQERTQERLEKIEGSLGKLLGMAEEGTLNGMGQNAGYFQADNFSASPRHHDFMEKRNKAQQRLGGDHRHSLTGHHHGHNHGQPHGHEHEHVPGYSAGQEPGPGQPGHAQEQWQEQGQVQEPVKEQGEVQMQATATSQKKTSVILKEWKANRSQNMVKTIDENSFLATLVGHPWFDSIIASVVVLNALLVGLQIEHDARDPEDWKPYTVIEYICTGIFTLELILRIIAMKQYFCARANRFWACFDVTLVLISWADVGIAIATDGAGALPGPGASIAKTVKMARMARLVRIIRMVKWLAKVRIMTTMIVGSMLSLFWLFVLILGVMYIFALVLTQGSTDWLRPPDNPPPTGHEVYQDMKDSFGGVFLAMYTLFLAMTGGVSWGEPASLTKEMGGFQWAIFCFFIFFTFFSVLNIVTGVFVDGAIQQANNDRSVLLMEQAASKKMLLEALMDLLGEIDTDDSGCISEEEWDAVKENEQLQSEMGLMGVSVDDADRLFKMLDTSGDGILSIEEYVEGMQKFRGNAQSIDVHVVLSRLNYLIHRVEHFFSSFHHPNGSHAAPFIGNGSPKGTSPPK